MKRWLLATLIITIVALSAVTVLDEVYGAGIPKKAISTVARFIKSDLPTVTVYTDQANTFGAFDQLFNALNLKIVDNTDATKIVTFDNSGMTTAKTLTIKPLSTTTQTLQIPSITATDTLATLALAQTFTAAKTFPASGIILGGAGAGLGTITYANSA
ncbi:MAG: hypothetical protein HY295_06350, partial [Thaumarchaeota archaeon]|nr:hypothetical protein [Nitrososphaerota archaeon]